MTPVWESHSHETPAQENYSMSFISEAVGLRPPEALEAQPLPQCAQKAGHGVKED